jgi:hypothetical protein
MSVFCLRYIKLDVASVRPCSSIKTTKYFLSNSVPIIDIRSSRHESHSDQCPFSPNFNGCPFHSFYVTCHRTSIALLHCDCIVFSHTRPSLIFFPVTHKHSSIKPHFIVPITLVSHTIFTLIAELQYKSEQ